MTISANLGFSPPPYPYDRLKPLLAFGDRFDGGIVDLSIGTPVDLPLRSVTAALSDSKAEHGYPPSIGTVALREAIAAWLEHEMGVHADPETQIAATIGTKEFVAGLPHWLRLRSPDRDTVLYPAVSYPSYAMGAVLAGARAVPVPVDADWSPRLDLISPHDAARALLLWMNTPGNPAGGLDDLAAAAVWGAACDVPVFSDECYAEFTWDGPPRTILSANPSSPANAEGVVAVHSLSKRSNLAGVRVGFYAGDAELVDYLKEVRKHAGFMVPGPTQAAAAVALADQRHVAEQRERYHSRLERLVGLLSVFGVEPSLPRGGFYLWVRAPDDDAWGFVRQLAEQIGLVVAPGEFFGSAASAYVRVAAVATEPQMELLARRINATCRSTAASA